MRHSGQLLVEIMVAVGILSMVLLSVTNLMTKSARLLTYERDREGAYSMAREILNQYRKERDTNPVAFFDTASGLSREVCYEGRKYGCKVEVVSLTGGLQINVDVFWIDKDKKYEIKIDQVLSKI
jgi:type II secretory pathway pseudopilin PulG